jgi:Uma2 family endonuclease
MAVRVSAPTSRDDWDDQEFYPLHEEDDVPEIPQHEATARYLRNALAARFPAWFVTGDVCIYWEPGNTKKYRAPDLLAVREPLAEEAHRVYLTWLQPPITFVAEIGSRSTFRADEGPKVEIYQDLVRAAEYYYADPPKGDQRLWRRGPDGYELVAPEPNGRLCSVELGLEFALEGESVRLYTLDGEMLLSHVETNAAWQAAEAARQEEARRRQEAEELRQAAERHRQEEAQRREAAEARAAELERQIAALRAAAGTKPAPE